MSIKFKVDIAIFAKACEKRRFWFIAKAKSHRLKPRFSSGSVFDRSHMRWSVISQTQQSWWFSLILSLKMSCFFEFHWLSSDLQVLKWLDFLNFIEFTVIYISWNDFIFWISLKFQRYCIDPNLDISCILSEIPRISGFLDDTQFFIWERSKTDPDKNREIAGF